MTYMNKTAFFHPYKSLNTWTYVLYVLVRLQSSYFMHVTIRALPTQTLQQSLWSFIILSRRQFADAAGHLLRKEEEKNEDIVSNRDVESSRASDHWLHADSRWEGVPRFYGSHVLPHLPLIFLPRGEEVELVPASDRVPDDVGLGGVGVERADGGKGGAVTCSGRRGSEVAGDGDTAGRLVRGAARHGSRPYTAHNPSSLRVARPLPPPMTMGMGTNMVRARALAQWSAYRQPVPGTGSTVPDPQPKPPSSSCRRRPRAATGEAGPASACHH